MNRKRLAITFLIVILNIPAIIAQVTLKLQAPRQCEVGQRIRVSYIANTTDIEDIQTGDFPGFNVLYGPSTSSSSSFSMINGKTSQSSTMTFTYTLAATKTGKFTIPAATVKCGGKQYKSGTASIEVLPSSGNSSQGNQGGNQGGGQASAQPRQQRSQASSGNISSKDLFITVTANKKKIYEQEAILLTYKLYTLVNISQIAGEMPQLDGFHVQELESKRQLSLKYEHVNGRNYGTAIWKQYVLFPQRSGKLTVPSISFDAQVEVINTSMDPFDIFFGGGNMAQMVKKTITTPAMQIDVKPLPTPKPANFSGAVGKFSISGSLTPNQVNANDAATLRLIVSGTGNMKLMKAPKVDFPKDFEVYDPKEDNKSQTTGAGAKGNVVYDYVVVPRHGGKFTVSPVQFVYFDPEAGSYKTLKTDSFQIAVAKAKGGSTGNYHGQEDLKVLDNDIRFIKLGDVKVDKSSGSFFGSTGYWIIYSTFLAIFLALVAIFNKQIKDNANVSRMRTKKASKEATKRLKNASKLLKNHEINGFYDEVMKALYGYVGDKLGLSNTELSKENVVEGLTKRAVAEDAINEYIKVLSDCEFARYAPGDPNEMMDKIYSDASTVINKLDSLIKKA